MPRVREIVLTTIVHRPHGMDHDDDDHDDDDDDNRYTDWSQTEPVDIVIVCSKNVGHKVTCCVKSST